MVEEKEIDLKKEITVDWNGNQPTETNFEKPKGIKEGLNTFVLTKIKPIQHATYDTRLKPDAEKIMKIDLVFKFLVPAKDHSGTEDAELSYWCPPIIKKGGWTNKQGKVASNSKAFDTILNCGLQDEAKKLYESGKLSNIAEIGNFLTQNLCDRPLNVMVETKNENTDLEYSAITKIKGVAE